MDLADILNSAGIVVLVTTVGNLIAKYLDRNNQYKRSIKKIAEIYDSFNRVIDESNAERVLILKSSNGGGKPSPGSDLYVSVIHEMSVKGVEQIKNQHQKILIDEAYLKIIQRIISERSVEIRVGELPENSFLRLLNDQEGFKQLYFFEIKSNADNYFFGIFSTKAETGFSKPDKLAFKLAIDSIKKVFENEK